MGKNNKQKEYENSHKVYICLDTNVIISLAGLHFHNEYEIRQMNKFGQYGDICELKKLIDKKEVIAVVTPIVLEELFQGMEKYGDETIRYLKKSNIKILDIPDNELETYFENVEKIATVYSGKLSSGTIKNICLNNNITNYKFPKSVFKAKKTEDGEIILQNDARIMAEASLLGVALVTNNTLDFISGHRQEIIRYINQKIHLPSKAIPFTAKDFLRRYNYNQVFSSPKKESVKHLTQPQDKKTKKPPKTDEMMPA